MLSLPTDVSFLMAALALLVAYPSSVSANGMQVDNAVSPSGDSSRVIVAPLNFHLLGKEYNFRFTCTFDEVEEQLVLTRRVADFCSDALGSLDYHWRYFYSDPLLCQSDMIGSIQALYVSRRMQADGISSVRHVLVSNSWCAEDNWLRKISQHERRVTSQEGQDGVLEYIFSSDGVGSTNKYYVEIGFNSAMFEGGTGSNTYNLYRQGWNGLLLDIANENATINLMKHHVTSENVVAILQHYQVPYEADYISIDIDSHDLWVFRSIVSSGLYRPRVFTIEFNPNLPLTSTLTIPPGFSGADARVDMLYGASAGAVKAVAEEFGYTVVHLIQRLDVVLIRTDLLNGACPVPFFLNYMKISRVQGCIRLPDRMFQWIDYKTWRDTDGNIDLAKSAAAEQLISSLNSKSPSKESKDRDLSCLGVDMDFAYKSI